MSNGFLRLPIYQADWKIKARGSAKICLADSTCDYFLSEEEEVKACVCLSASAKPCGILLFAFVSSLCKTLHISIRISHHSLLCLFKTKASCVCSVSFYTEMSSWGRQMCKLFMTCWAHHRLNVGQLAAVLGISMSKNKQTETWRWISHFKKCGPKCLISYRFPILLFLVLNEQKKGLLFLFCLLYYEICMHTDYYSL